MEQCFLLFPSVEYQVLLVEDCTLDQMRYKMTSAVQLPAGARDVNSSITI